LYSDSGLAIVAGIPPIRGGAPTQLNIHKIRPKVLCERHNNCLSGLDSLSLKFFAFLLESTPQPNTLMINGYDLERWFLKVLCGSAAAGFVQNDSGIVLTEWLPPTNWLEILYGDSAVPEDSGLTFLTNITASAPYGRIWMQPQFFLGPPKELAGIAFVLDQFTFLLTMRHLAPSDRTRRRPAVFQIQKQSVVREVHFGWRNDVLVGVRIKPNPARDQPSAHVHDIKTRLYRVGTFEFSLPLRIVTRGVRKSDNGETIVDGFPRVEVGSTPCAAVFTDSNLAREHAEALKESNSAEAALEFFELVDIPTTLEALAMFRRNGLEFVAFGPPAKPGNSQPPVHISKIAASLFLPLSILATNLR
jgi:hypothetical protein